MHATVHREVVPHDAEEERAEEDDDGVVHFLCVGGGGCREEENDAHEEHPEDGDEGDGEAEYAEREGAGFEVVLAEEAGCDWCTIDSCQNIKTSEKA